MTRRLLVVAAHPDDEVLGCGGLVARVRREGGAVDVMFITEGSSAQYPDEPDMMARKEREAAAAAEQLGGVEVHFLRLPELRLASLAAVEIHGPVAAAVKELRPDWVLTHHAGDLNRDHGVVHEAARVACRPRPEYAPRLLTFEVLSSTEWGTAPFQPNFFVPLEEQDLRRKQAALEAYTSELRPWPHPRSTTAVEHLARRRGAQAGVELAEAFVGVWERL